MPYPYAGPKLRWLRTANYVPMDADASELSIDIDCPECRRTSFDFQMDGIVVRRSDWKGQKLFHLKQYSDSDAMYIPEPALEQLLSAGFTNLGYVEVGVIGG